MTETPDQARDDLAFLRTVVAEGQPFARSFGELYAFAGIAYGIQCLVALVAISVPQGFPTWAHLVNGILPTAGFLAFMAYVLLRDRKTKLKGPIPRAIDAAFSGTGLANLVMIAVFGVAAFRRGDFTLWLFYGVTVFAIQGAVWYGIAILRRRWWMGAVAVGWLGCALAGGLLVDHIVGYLAVLAFGLFAFMAAPGIALMRMSRRG